VNRIPPRLLFIALLQACASPSASSAPPAGAPAVAPAIERSLPERLDLFVGDSRVLAARTTRIAVGNGKVLSVSPVSAGQLVLIGQSPGSTVVQLWLRDGTRHRMVVTVASSDLEATLGAVRELLSGVDGVSARPSGQRIVLEGGRAGARARERAAAIAALYPGVVLDFVGKVGWELMLNFEVRIVEFRRGRLRELGIRWRDDTTGPTAGVIADFISNDRFRAVAPDPGISADAFVPLPGKTALKGYLGIAATLDSRLRMLEKSGEATIVAEPMLSCRSGGAARFVAGGEIPVPVVNGVGSTDIEYREYGVILDVKPVADEGGTVFARIETELSQVDGSQTVLGVPGLLKRRSATDVNLRSGETLVIAGLASRQSSNDVGGIPGLSRLPVGGRLFGVRGRRGDESELVIFITPRIADPEPVIDGTAAWPAPVSLDRGRQLIERLDRER
jgi:pilus assembly protein CpaC